MTKYLFQYYLLWIKTDKRTNKQIYFKMPYIMTIDEVVIRYAFYHIINWPTSLSVWISHCYSRALKWPLKLPTWEIIIFRKTRRRSWINPSYKCGLTHKFICMWFRFLSYFHLFFFHLPKETEFRWKCSEENPVSYGFCSQTPGAASGGIFYPSVVPDPHSKIHAEAVMTIPHREVLWIREVVVHLSLLFGTELWCSINSGQLNSVASYH